MAIFQITPQAIFTSFKLPKSNQLPSIPQSSVIATVEEFPVSNNYNYLKSNHAQMVSFIILLITFFIS